MVNGEWTSASRSSFAVASPFTHYSPLTTHDSRSSGGYAAFFGGAENAPALLICAIFSSRIKNGNAPLIYEDGNQSRDFVHVSDIVQANLLAMEKPEANYEMFNVGTGNPVTISEITQLLIKLYKKTVQPQIAGKFRSGDIRHCIADITKIKQLGFQPRVALEQGMQELVKWGEQETAVDRVAQAARELEERGLVT